MAVVLTSEQRAAAEAIARKRFGSEVVPVWLDQEQQSGAKEVEIMGRLQGPVNIVASAVTEVDHEFDETAM